MAPETAERRGGPFRDRTEAGSVLAEHLAAYRERDPIVIGLPRGGVVVAAAVARALGAELDIAIVRKVGAPGNPELAVGAVGEGGVVVRNGELLALLGLSEAAFRRRADAATGATAEAAVAVMLARGADEVVVGVPVGAPDAVARLAAVADRVICVDTPRSLGGVGAWYDDFTAVTEDEVARLLLLR